MTQMPMMKGDHAWKREANLYTSRKDRVLFIKVEWPHYPQPGPHTVMPWHAYYDTLYSPSERGGAIITGAYVDFTFISRKVQI